MLNSDNINFELQGRTRAHTETIKKKKVQHCLLKFKTFFLSISKWRTFNKNVKRVQVWLETRDGVFTAVISCFRTLCNISHCYWSCKMVVYILVTQCSQLNKLQKTSTDHKGTQSTIIFILIWWIFWRISSLLLPSLPLFLFNHLFPSSFRSFFLPLLSFSLFEGFIFILIYMYIHLSMCTCV